MREIKIEILGKPTTKERPRFSGGRTYTPKRTKDYEKYVKEQYLFQGGIDFGEVPLEVTMRFIFPIMKSWTKKKQKQALSGELKMTSRPDADNLAKSVLDSLNGVAYKDDSQIATLYCYKEYGEQAKTILQIKPMKGVEL